MAQARRRWSAGILFSVVLLLLVSLAATDVGVSFAMVMLVSAGGAGALFYHLFPRSAFVAVVFANLITVYSCLFIFFVEANFARAHEGIVLVGFVLPILAFLLGAARLRREIGTLMASAHLRDERGFAHVIGWLVPVFLIGALSFLVPRHVLTAPGHDIALLAAMAGISAIVSLVSRDVSIFLLDTGLLFEEFFQRVARLRVPAFAFLTFYSLLVIIFGAIYRIIDHFSADFLFRVDGVAQRITFPEALYFSIVTLSTVGYGDITPTANLARIVVALQIVCGVLLLLFGFSEIIAYTRDHGRSPR
jgi:voltage-gated potassium channel